MSEFGKCPFCSAEVLGGPDQPHNRGDTDYSVLCNGEPLSGVPEPAMADTPDVAAMDAATTLRNAHSGG